MNKIETILSEARKNTKYNSAYSIETNCEIHNRLYGEDSCFLVLEEYHSYYDDDYSTLTYYSNVTGEYFKDRWTTAAACPSYDYFKLCKTFEEAEKEGLINIDIWNANWKPSKYELSEFLIKNINEFVKFEGVSPFVKVYRGRSNKNRTGWFVGEKTVNNKGWKTIMHVIYDPENAEFFMVKKGYCMVEEKFAQKINDAVNAYKEAEMNVTDRLRKYSSEIHFKIICDLFFNGDYKGWKYNMDIKMDIWSANWNAQQNIIKYAPSEKLLQWVRDHFKNVTDENEIYDIAYKINKKNARI